MISMIHFKRIDVHQMFGAMIRIKISATLHKRWGNYLISAFQRTIIVLNRL